MEHGCEDEDNALLEQPDADEYEYQAESEGDEQDGADPTDDVQILTDGSTLVHQDVIEINNDCHGVYAGFRIWPKTQTINVWIAMEPSRFLLNTVRSLAWGIQPDKLVCFEVRFHATHPHAAERPTVEKAYQLTREAVRRRLGDEDLWDQSLETLTSSGDARLSFGLAWMLMDRANAFIRDDSVWPFFAAREHVHELQEVLNVSEEVAKAALKEAKGDFSDATALLVDAPSRQRLEAEAQAEAQAAAESSSADASVIILDDDEFTDSPAEELLQQLRELFPNASSTELMNAVEASGLCREVAVDILLDHYEDVGGGANMLVVQDLFVQEMTDEARKRRRFEETLADTNFLIRLIHFVEDTIRTCNQRCLVCDDPVDYISLRPVVCPKPLCIMSYEELGIGIDVAAEMMRDPDVMDLMIAMLYDASNAGRVELAFPENVKVQTADGRMHSFMREGAQNRQLLSQVVDLIPSVNDMLAFAQNGNLRAGLDSVHPLLYPLLKWLISSNRAHLRRLPPEEEVKGLGTSHQFVLLTGPLERESNFQRLKAETARRPGRGSIFAFHGSAAGNWHSILRLGLKNFSNTGYMSAGAAYGPGVYFATQLTASLGYCIRRGASGWPRSRFGNNCTFMALCELINRPEKYSYNSGGVMVVPKEEYITTRYFLVNPNGIADSKSLQLNLASTLCLRAPVTRRGPAGEGADGADRKRSRWGRDSCP